MKLGKFVEEPLYFATEYNSQGFLETTRFLNRLLSKNFLKLLPPVSFYAEGL